MRMNADKRPIGIFDSGVGGLTVADKIRKVLPRENIIYFGDTARVPYGNKSRETVTRFSKEIARFLRKFKVKLIVVACNTASSLSLKALQKSFPIPIVGVIKPGAEEALKASKNNRIGIIGTEATISSGAYKKEIKKINGSSFVAESPCPLFVPLVENKWLNDDITRKVAKRYLTPLLSSNVDALILGCTHYPLLKKMIRGVAGKNVTLIDSSFAVANFTKHLLAREGLLNRNGSGGSVKFFVSDDTKNFTDLAKIFLKKNIKVKKVVL